LPTLSYRELKEHAQDLSALHQIRQDELVVELFFKLHKDSYTPISDPEIPLHEIHKSTILWFEQAAAVEKQESGIIFPGIYEAQRFYTGDLLIQEKNGSWTLYLVKSGSKVKERYVQEADWIKRGFSRIGISIHLVRLLLPSKDFSLSQDQDYKLYFEEISLTHDVKHLRRSSEYLVSSLESRLRNTPSMLELEGKSRSEIDSFLCNFPGNCPLCFGLLQETMETSTYQKSFTQTQPLDYSVFQLFRSGSLAKKLQAEGIVDIRDISRAPTFLKRELKERHFIQAEAFRTGEPQILKEKLLLWFNQLIFPLEFLDFESFSSAIPPFPETEPWQPIPFAVSLTKVTAWDELGENLVWIAPPSSDGRLELIQLLIQRFDTHPGSILVYGKEFEVSILKKLHDQTSVQEYKKKLLTYIGRIVDVQDVFSQFWYYHPAQGAKISLKNLVPLLTKGNQYKDLTIQDGAAASFGYFFQSYPDPLGRTWDLGLLEWTTYEEELKKYAALDTIGLAEIVNTLHRATS